MLTKIISMLIHIMRFGPGSTQQWNTFSAKAYWPQHVPLKLGDGSDFTQHEAYPSPDTWEAAEKAMEEAASDVYNDTSLTHIIHHTAVARYNLIKAWQAAWANDPQEMIKHLDRCAEEIMCGYSI